MDGRNLHFYEHFTCFAKVYPVNYFTVWIQKSDIGFSTSFHYFCLLLLILLLMYANTNLKICLHIKKYAEGFAL